MSIFGVCTRQNSYVQRAINNGYGQLQNGLQFIQPYMSRVAAATFFPIAYLQQAYQREVRMDQEFWAQEIDDRQNLINIDTQIAYSLKVIALVCACLSMSFSVATIGGFIAAPTGLASLTIIPAVALAVLAYDFMKISKNITEDLKRGAHRPIVEIWNNDYIYDQVLVMDKIFSTKILSFLLGSDI